MLLSEICIKRPIFGVVLSLMMVTIGAIFFTKLPIKGIPDIDPPIITVNAPYPGADALYMAKEITTRLEKALKNVKGLDFIKSESKLGMSTITMSFKLTTDIEVALNDVRSKILAVSHILPDDMALPLAAKFDSDNLPTLWLAVTTNIYDDMSLTRIVENNVVDQLAKLPTVGSAILYGAKIYTMRIAPIPLKMQQYNMSPTEIAAVIKKQNKDYPAGEIKTDFRNFALRLTGTLTTAKEFKNIILKVEGQNIVKLQDVAEVYLAPLEDETILRYNGHRAMAVAITKQSNANLLELSREVKAQLANIVNTLPVSVKVHIAYDGATPVSASVKSVFVTILEALVLVVLVTYLFLGSLKITIIPFVTIPVSLISTFSVMYFMGFSINTFTLLAMMLAIGLVVDDAIVMLENIFRHHELTNSKQQGSITAVNEISFAIVAMTLTLAAVFLPIGFIEGFLGKLFIEFAWTLAFAVLFSGFVALTLTPMMASVVISKNHAAAPVVWQTFAGYLEVVYQQYLQLLNLSLNNKGKCLLLAGSAILVLIVSFSFVDKIFVPQEDDGYLQIAFIGPEGSTAKQSVRSVIKAEAILANTKEVIGYFNVINSDNAFAFVPLQDWALRNKSQETIKNELNRKFAAIPGMSVFAMSPRSLASGNAHKAIEFNLQSSLDYEQINQISQEFVSALKTYPHFLNIERNLKSATPTLDIVVNREKAYLYGVSLADIGSTIEYLIAGKQVGDFKMNNDIYQVILRYNIDNRNHVGSVNNILVKAKHGMLPLEVIAQVVETITVKSYSHYNGAKAVTISADLAPQHKIKDAIAIINKIAAGVYDKSTTKLEYLGEIKRMHESNSKTYATFLFALIFIYLVLSAQFNSFTDPLLILTAVPFSITGGVVLLLLTGNSINIYSNIGLVTLIGLVTKNSIMIVEFANQLKNQGLQCKAAIIQSATLRLRPILMTTLATIFGAVPLIFTHGAGEAARSSIGLVIVGGMAIGTLFTIFVIPVLYLHFKDTK